MYNIDIERIKDIKDELDSLRENDVLFVDENGKSRYVVMPIELYDAIEDVAMMAASTVAMPQVRIANPEDIELSYDEYERIKKQIMDAVEKTLMPKPEKLN
ncbi:MAG: hypothetical protein IJI92_04365 [Erysipelotrichaceae bacterium]|nr:hypothetical protein [Erysipelotrichaceae bacterium]